MPRPQGVIVSVNMSAQKGEKKHPVGSAYLREGHGIEQDAHAGDWHRQVSLLAQESIDKIRAAGMDVDCGDFAENLTTLGLILHTLPIGTRFKIGDQVVLRLTQIGKECHTRCAIFTQVGDCVMPREGIFAEVVHGGEVRTGDVIEVVD